jgi:hypothetical protein
VPGREKIQDTRGLLFLLKAVECRGGDWILPRSVIAAGQMVLLTKDS